jgi:hypothetical protein
MPFSVIFGLHPPRPPSGEQTQHVIKNLSKGTLLSLYIVQLLLITSISVYMCLIHG